MRHLLLPLCVAVLLSACGSDEQGKDVPRKNSEPAVAVEPAKPAQPVEKSEPPAAQEAPAVKPQAAESQPEAVQKPASAEPKKTIQRAKPDKAQKVVQTSPKTKLDLSLPPELAAALDAEDKSASDGVPPILPSFFEEQKSSPNPFQVSGKLLTGELGSEYWNAVEGAELQFEFRR